MMYKRPSVISRRRQILLHRAQAARASARAALRDEISRRVEQQENEYDYLMGPLFSNTDLTEMRLPRSPVMSLSSILSGVFPLSDMVDSSESSVFSGVFPLTDKCSDIDTQMQGLFTDQSSTSLHVQNSVVSGVFPLTDRVSIDNISSESSVESSSVFSGVFPLTDKCSDFDTKMGGLFTDNSSTSLHIVPSVVSGVFPLTDLVRQESEELYFEDIKHSFTIARPNDSGFSGVFPLTDWAETPSMFQLFSDDCHSIENVVNELCDKVANVHLSPIDKCSSFSSVFSDVFPLSRCVSRDSIGWSLTGFFDQDPSFFELSVRDIVSDDALPVCHSLTGDNSPSFLTQMQAITQRLREIQNRLDSLKNSPRLLSIAPLPSNSSVESGYLASSESSTSDASVASTLQNSSESECGCNGRFCSSSDSYSSLLEDDDSQCSCDDSHNRAQIEDSDTGYSSVMSCEGCEHCLFSDDQHTILETENSSFEDLSEVFCLLFGSNMEDNKRANAGMEKELMLFNCLLDEEYSQSTSGTSLPLIVFPVDSLEIMSPRNWRIPSNGPMGSIEEVLPMASVPDFTDDVTPPISPVLSDNWFRHAMEDRRKSIVGTSSEVSIVGSWCDSWSSLNIVPRSISLPNELVFSSEDEWIHTPFVQIHSDIEMSSSSLLEVPDFSLLPQSSIESIHPVDTVCISHSPSISIDDINEMKKMVEQQRDRWILLAMTSIQKISQAEAVLQMLNRGGSDC